MIIIEKKKYFRRGFTLLEGLMAMSILSFAAAGVLLPFASGASIQVEAARITVASKLAGDLLEEISVSSLDLLADDWNGFSETAGAMKDYSDNIINDSGAYSGLSRHVSVDLVSGLDSVAADDTVNNYWVTVTVKHNGDEVVSLSRLFFG